SITSRAVQFQGSTSQSRKSDSLLRGIRPHGHRLHARYCFDLPGLRWLNYRGEERRFTMEVHTFGMTTNWIDRHWVSAPLCETWPMVREVGHGLFCPKGED